jgi:membrane protease YdiL (CAAX protease family)
VLAAKSQVPPALVWPLLIFIILGEEILWRNAVTVGIGGWRGAAVGAVAFAIAHVSLGMPALILAAFGAGLVWSVMVVATKSAWPAFVCHLAWDAAAMVLLPYATS